MSDVFNEYLDKIENPEYRAILQNLLEWVLGEFPELNPEIKWNQPMFLHHGTFIIAFSASKQHFSVAPERMGIVTFEDEFKKRNISYSKMLFQFKYNQVVDFDLIHKVISFNIEDKKDYSKFWR